VLTLTFARTETIDRLIFRNAKGTVKDDPTRGSAPCEYFIETSVDGVTWRRVADSDDREPFSPAHAAARFRREAMTPANAKALNAVTQEIARLDAAIAAVPPLTQMWIGTHVAKPEPTFVHKGGDPMKPAHPVVPASLGVLDQVTKPFALPADAPDGARRVALADWITHDETRSRPACSPTASGKRHFGTGLVDTPSDFGFGSAAHRTRAARVPWRAAGPPGWKLKPPAPGDRCSPAPTCSPPRIASTEPRPTRTPALPLALPAASPAGRGDPRHLARRQRQTAPRAGRRSGLPSLRLSREQRLDLRAAGETRTGDCIAARSYHQNARASVVDILSDYDLPDIAFAAPKRANTTSPLQSLTLFNHSFTLDMAESLAARLTGKDPIAEAYRLTFRRSPSPQEQVAAEKLITKHGKTAFCRALLNTNELIFVE
jgi:hypothetical protein